MKRYRGIGLMSGTSLDGVDLAYCEFTLRDDRWTFELLTAETLPYDEAWYARLRCLDEQDGLTFAKTNVYYGHYLGRLVAHWVERNELKPQFVASHGQTIFHQPEKNFTVQIGDGESMVAYLPCPLVTNFRNKDVALGGQGAPLVPYGERHLFPNQELFLNLGGIANLSYKDLAYDVTICNMALNWLCQSMDPPRAYDHDGALASEGQLNAELFDGLEALPFYRQSPPKSLGTEWFTAEVLPLISRPEVPVEDRLHTVVFHLVVRITAALKALKIGPAELMVTGGGARNRFLMETLEQALAAIDIRITAAPPEVIDFKEAIIFAFLGLQALRGEPNVLQSVTGARMDNLGGSIHMPPGGFPLPILD